MMHRTLVLELLDDCVFSARSATAGSHESLNHVPGSTLLGAAASRLYGAIGLDAAFDAFHSGRLRFGDGLPWDGISVGYPMPLSWHYSKLEKPSGSYQGAERLIPERVHNFLYKSAIGKPDQPKQIRHGHVHADGRWTKHFHALRLKTAIESASGRAAEGQLFGYDALARGQHFAAHIEADDDLDPELFGKVVEALSGEILLGRSRSAEFGRVGVRSIGAAPPPPGPVEGNVLTLWLLSDLALSDEGGQPMIMPDGQSLGLPDGSVVWSKTFLRQRRYSPWNAARRGYDRERWVLAAGGVISVELPAPADAQTFARLHAGIGLYREAGLGRLWVNPPLLAGPHPGFTPIPATEQAGAQRSRPSHPLLDWLSRQDSDWKAAAETSARELARDYQEEIKNARRLHGLTARASDFGPSKSQWGRVLDAARRKEGQALFEELFSGDGAIIKSSGAGWSVKIPGPDGKLQQLASWLMEKLPCATAEGSAQPPASYAHLIRQLAHRVRGDIKSGADES